MPKKGISSLELTAIVNELQFLVKGRISQIYHQEKKELLFQLHAPGKGKQLLKIIPGKFLCLTTQKETPLRPTGFCMQLRKYINNAFVKDFYQKGAERIVVLELEKTERYYLIIELFSKGNIILTDVKHKIISVLEWQIWKDRTVKPNEKYLFPLPGINWKELTGKQLATILRKSKKKNVVISLATELGLGGLYAEEICKRKEIDKNKLPQEVEEKEVKLIVKTIKEFLKEIEKPKGHIYEEEIAPFPLLGKKPVKKTSTYNAAISTLQLAGKTSPYEKRIQVIKRMISGQEEAIKRLKKKIVDNTQKGEQIYEKYTPLQKLLDIVKELQKEKNWKEIAQELKKEKKIKSVDLKSKKVVIEF